MALIEGVGDEVIQVFVYFLLFLIGVVAWWSTRITERPLVRTVLILERRGNRQVAGEPPPTPAEPASSSEEKPTDEPTIDQAQTSTASLDATDRDPEINTIVTQTTAAGYQVLEASSEDVTVRNRRLAYYEDCSMHPVISQGEGDDSINNSSEPFPLPECTLETTPDVEPVVDSKVQSLEAIVDAEANISERPQDEPHNIRIRLKYLNDDLKMVDGNLEEQLGDFKRRHFSLELSGRKLVRLIFNGQVLGQDTWTLGHYGLFDNCVVHCLVHNPRTPPPSPNLNTREGSSRRPQLSAWAVGNVLLAGLSILLGLAWYGRYHYAHLYTATTTVALVGLTGLFTVSLIGIYMPEFMQN